MPTSCSPLYHLTKPISFPNCFFALMLTLMPRKMWSCMPPTPLWRLSISFLPLHTFLCLSHQPLPPCLPPHLGPPALTLLRMLMAMTPLIAMSDPTLMLNPAPFVQALPFTSIQYLGPLLLCLLL